MIKIKAILHKVEGKWKAYRNANHITEDDLDQLVIKLSSGRVFVLTEKDKYK